MSAATSAGSLRLKRRRFVQRATSFFPGTDQRTDFIDTVPQRRVRAFATGMLRLLAWPLAAAALAAGVMLWNNAQSRATEPEPVPTNPAAAPRSVIAAGTVGATTAALPPQVATASTPAASALATAAPAAPSQAQGLAPVQAPAPSPAASTVQSTVVALGSVAHADTAPRRVSVPLAGHIAALAPAVVAAEGPGGRVIELRVQPGDTVQRGQVLAVLDGALAEAELARLQAQVQLARAALAEAQGLVQGMRSVAGSGAFSIQQEQQFLAAEQTARARLGAAQAAVRVQQLRLRQLSLVAPVSGVVAQRLVALGAVVGSGQAVYELIGEGRLAWHTELPAVALPLVVPGMQVRIGLADGSVVTGAVQSVAPVVDPRTGTGRISAEMPPHPQLRPGSQVQAELLPPAELVDGPPKQATDQPLGRGTGT